MECPACGEALNEVKVQSIYLDTCAACRGIWFDSEELVEILKVLMEDKTLTSRGPYQILTREQAIAANRVPERERSCPRCAKAMVKFNYAYDSNVVLDRCNHCRGIWADGGEVWAIVQFLRNIKGR